MSSGSEIRLYDPRRNPRNWTDLMRPADCAVFLKHRTTSASLDRDGRPFADPDDTTCIVFDNLDDAQEFCEARVRQLPELRCEIFDAQGLARPPMMIVVHPAAQSKEDASSVWSRRRKAIAVLLVLASAPLFWIGARGSNSGDLAIFFGINCLVLASRFVYWDVGVRHREKERRRRLDEHRKIERGDA